MPQELLVISQHASTREATRQLLQHRRPRALGGAATVNQPFTGVHPTHTGTVYRAACSSNGERGLPPYFITIAAGFFPSLQCGGKSGARQRNERVTCTLKPSLPQVQDGSWSALPQHSSGALGYSGVIPPQKQVVFKGPSYTTTKNRDGMEESGNGCQSTSHSLKIVALQYDLADASRCQSTMGSQSATYPGSTAKRSRACKHGKQRCNTRKTWCPCKWFNIQRNWSELLPGKGLGLSQSCSRSAAAPKLGVEPSETGRVARAAQAS